MVNSPPMTYVMRSWNLCFDFIERGKLQVFLMKGDLSQELGADQVQAIDGAHQRIGNVEFGRLDIPVWMCQRAQGDQSLAGWFLPQ